MSNNPTGEKISFPVIGIVYSCFKEKFGIPRQPGLASAAQAVIEIAAPYNTLDAFEGLGDCSHIWLQFVFHKSLHHAWRPKVRPPRLGGNRSVGVFATRSPVRPSAIGLSVVRLERIEGKNGVQLYISGADLLEGTPILDIKPYVPYVDSVPEALNRMADAPPSVMAVRFSGIAKAQIDAANGYDNLAVLIEQVLEQDPRPQYQKTDEARTYGMKLYEFNLKWRYCVEGSVESIEVLELVPLLI
ncbi:tRNA (N6-threonylcarbamoyladenosine(37)-N6)-methyltransferase TrmO [Teredinibacter purpureus]|uniref:tRNA (N6-threonylcarbamoyladenosine(37)-N6)-methyltransferase TrmO n=1 Tax=Teredinibacter purpureus TaxID=2731756 RepID=UPI0005F82DDD|nr:tRNA (N6-threonylcarbamoyladenosine(37)-N6)-methyltransferase TrmO [Teredinibacter purpureus]